MTFILIALKEQGNEAFVKGDYETAILRYSKGLEKMKDMKVLYTNRAQVSEPQMCPWGCLREQLLLNLRKQDKDKSRWNHRWAGSCLGCGEN